MAGNDHHGNFIYDEEDIPEREEEEEAEDEDAPIAKFPEMADCI